MKPMLGGCSGDFTEKMMLDRSAGTEVPQYCAAVNREPTFGADTPCSHFSMRKMPGDRRLLKHKLSVNQDKRRRLVFSQSEIKCPKWIKTENHRCYENDKFEACKPTNK